MREQISLKEQLLTRELDKRMALNHLESLYLDAFILRNREAKLELIKLKRMVNKRP